MLPTSPLVARLTLWEKVNSIEKLLFFSADFEFMVEYEFI
jgi:hypothetical protein